jgi:hypothetical protein
MKTLFLPTTPLHAFFAVGLMRGPFRDHQHTLALISRLDDTPDHIADALQASATSGVTVVRFPKLKGYGPARRLLGEISACARAIEPSVIAVGNDRRTEFYAAVRGCPSARRIYLDDGLHSYLPHHDVQSAWRRALDVTRRRLRYGLPVERPPMIGGSTAVQEAYVLLPQQVHEGLRGKPVQPLQPSWFADPWVRGICTAAASLAGLDTSLCRSIGLLLLLPHPRFLESYPELRQQIEALAARHAERGELVALKAHPRAGLPLARQLKVPPHSVVELPALLPIEVLVPLLSGTLVVGSLTTALLSLALLGEHLTVHSLLPPATPGAEGHNNDRTLNIYRSVGIHPFDLREISPP